MGITFVLTKPHYEHTEPEAVWCNKQGGWLLR